MMKLVPIFPEPSEHSHPILRVIEDSERYDRLVGVIHVDSSFNVRRVDDKIGEARVLGIFKLADFCLTRVKRYLDFDVPAIRACLIRVDWYIMMV